MAEAVAHLLKIVVCYVLRDPERFVQVRPADMEIGDHVAAAQHCLCDCYGGGEGSVGIDGERGDRGWRRVGVHRGAGLWIGELQGGREVDAPLLELMAEFGVDGGEGEGS